MITAILYALVGANWFAFSAETSSGLKLLVCSLINSRVTNVQHTIVQYAFVDNDIHSSIVFDDNGQ